MLMGILHRSKGLKAQGRLNLPVQECIAMPKTAKKRRSKRGDGPMPSGGAGLIRFFEDETPGIKVGPTLVVILAAMLVIAVVVSHVATQFGWI